MKLACNQDLHLLGGFGFARNRASACRAAHGVVARQQHRFATRWRGALVLEQLQVARRRGAAAQPGGSHRRRRRPTLLLLQRVNVARIGVALQRQLARAVHRKHAAIVEQHQAPAVAFIDERIVAAPVALRCQLVGAPDVVGRMIGRHQDRSGNLCNRRSDLDVFHDLYRVQ